ncbi:MAG: 2-C-methyl-D-erythritol 4-phosphate cytidylyltransferase [Brevinematia bacterium]
MYNSRRVVSVLLAGGKSQRFSLNVPKQLFELNGKPIIEYSLYVFETNPLVDEVIVTVNSLFIYEIERICSKFNKVRKVVEGGETRSISSRIGVLSIDEENSYVLIHDSARPFVTHSLIEELLKKVEETGAVIPCVKSLDSLAQIEDGRVVKVLERDKILRVQTPQCFKYEVIYLAYKSTEGTFIDLPDDSSLVIQKNLATVRVIEGDINNIKITTSEDIKIAMSILGTFQVT